MREKVLTCDIKDRGHSGVVETIKLQVIFDHDQEDGKSKMPPYLDFVEIEICDGCRRFMLQNRRYIYAYGAMGYNDYSL